MTVTVILTIVDALGTVPKDLKNRLWELEITGRNKTIQTTALHCASSQRLQLNERQANNCSTAGAEVIVIFYDML